MKKVLLKNISMIYTFDDQDRIFENSSILVEGSKIISIGPDLPEAEAGEIIPCDGLVALPGFVNTHHRLYQTLFRGIREVQEQPLFPWLVGYMSSGKTHAGNRVLRRHGRFRQLIDGMYADLRPPLCLPATSEADLH
jgi:cytosine/adenosine deaminase-related metal-dependent hydrolase